MFPGPVWALADLLYGVMQIILPQYIRTCTESSIFPASLGLQHNNAVWSRFLNLTDISGKIRLKIGKLIKLVKK